jgi:hypothetical protein
MIISTNIATAYSLHILKQRVKKKLAASHLERPYRRMMGLEESKERLEKEEFLDQSHPHRRDMTRGSVYAILTGSLD